MTGGVSIWGILKKFTTRGNSSRPGKGHGFVFGSHDPRGSPRDITSPGFVWNQFSPAIARLSRGCVELLPGMDVIYKLRLTDDFGWRYSQVEMAHGN